ncbi:hypothetical protein BKA69DRAFT_82220 [Paraphysoderma sedebokerense]|nr:hypothetical protein BKA69DRAFT_82220 [Paraphysoderma sedebokerense]
MCKGSHAAAFKSIHALTHPQSHPSEIAKLGVHIHGVDARNCDGLVKQMMDMDVVIVIPTEDEFGNRIPHGKAYLRAARDARAKAVILFSSVGCENPEVPHLHQFFELEEYLQYESDIENWVIVRCNFYMQNLLFFASHCKQTGTLRLPIGDDSVMAKCAMVDVRDVARAFASLASHPRALHTRHKNQLYTITSENPLSAESIQEILTQTLEKQVQVNTNVSFADTFSRLYDQSQETNFISQLNSLNQSNPGMMLPTKGLSESDIERVLEFFDLWKGGKLNFLSLDYYHLTGRPAIKLRDFVKDYWVLWAENE